VVFYSSIQSSKPYNCKRFKCKLFSESLNLTPNSDVLDSISQQIDDRATAIIQRLDQRFDRLEQTLRPNGNLRIERPAPIEIPARLGGFLTIAARLKHRDLYTAPLGQCIDAAVCHFTMAKELSRLAHLNDSPESCILDMLIGSWILNNVIKPGREYRQACSETLTNEYDRQLGACGLALEAFVKKLEEVSDRFAMTMSTLLIQFRNSSPFLTKQPREILKAFSPKLPSFSN
jgi:hypothetical protein